MKFGIITQARMGSSRLPGKILLRAGEATFLDYHLNRLQKSPWPVIVATTTDPQDDLIVEFCKRRKINHVRGSETNVLSRFQLAAQTFQLDHICRVTSDCPFIDPQLIQEGFGIYKKRILNSKSLTYLSNTIERTYPRGFDFEIFSAQMLNEAFHKSNQSYEQEHVTPFFYKSYPEKYDLYFYKNKTNESKYRLTLDEIDDFRLLSRMITEFRAQDKNFHQILEILKLHPELEKINSHVEQKKL